MRGEKTIEFPFVFKYSDGGRFCEAMAVTVRAPGLGKRQVHDTMTAHVAEAVMGIARNKEVFGGEAAKTAAATDDDDSEAKPAVDEEQDVMVLMAMGLGADRYPKFAAYVQSVLTNTPRLAVVADTEQPITDAVWESIAEAGGMEAVNRVMSEFCNFFFAALGGPRKKIGKGLIDIVVLESAGGVAYRDAADMPLAELVRVARVLDKRNRAMAERMKAGRR